MSDNTIRIVPKPEEVSWQEVKECLVFAHEINRKKGINMSHYQWPAEQIGEYVDSSGVMFLAMDGDKVVGTLGIKERIGDYWFVKGKYAYLCFGSMIPSYKGRGIYKSLNEACEEYARQNHLDVLAFDTHSDNKHMQEISSKGGFRFVRFFQTRDKDHFSVVMAKWLNSCPYSRFYCQLMFLKSKWMTLLRARILHK